MPASGGHLRAILRRADFRRLYTTRLTSQFGDGLFQAGLAATILFNPDRHTSPLAIALGFAVLLLPYSVIGPFAGVVLDRISRRHVLVIADLLRAALVPLVASLIWFGVSSIVFLLTTLLIVGVTRFFQSGLSASVPHTVPTEHLVTANSLCSTTGGLAYACGIGIAMALRPFVGSGDHGYAIIASSAIIAYLLSGLIASGFARRQLGPDYMTDMPPPRVALGTVLAGIAGGARHLWQRPVAAAALLGVVGMRICHGIGVIATVLLYRNYFADDGFFLADESGMAQVVVASALGNMAAALVTPAATRTWGGRNWILAMICAAGAAQLALGSAYLLPTTLLTVFAVVFAAHGAKIVADTAVQISCDDDFRGRVFAVYDTLFNVCFVAGMVLGALTLPSIGKSYPVLAGVAIGSALLALAYLAITRKHTTRIVIARQTRPRVQPAAKPVPELVG